MHGKETKMTFLGFISVDQFTNNFYKQISKHLQFIMAGTIIRSG